VSAAPLRAHFRFHGNPVRHPVEPAAQRLALGDRRGFAHQDKEGGLESIFGILLMMQDAPANAEHHWAVMVDERPKGLGVARGDEPLE
jgi:hypothetical protein